MKKILPSLISIIFSVSCISAQQRQHRIVFDFTKADTASFNMMMRQAKNILNATGNAQLEIVCHGPGLDMVMKEKTTVQAEIEELSGKYNVVFAACEATMRRRGVDKSQLLPLTVTVPLANLEFSSRQQDGWAYIKAGW
jgi:intracellular sulfur oxidation DsrE/DsrF family protein